MDSASYRKRNSLEWKSQSRHLCRELAIDYNT
jgi:hypothetical protein